jgi:hypothetical protein
MLASIEAKLIALAVVLALLVGAYAYAHHEGAVSQKAADDKTLANANVQISNRQAQLDVDAAAFLKINTDAKAAQAKAAIDKKAADAAVTLSQSNAKAAAMAAAAWQLKFNKAAQSKPCASVMEQTVCAAVFEH